MSDSSTTDLPSALAPTAGQRETAPGFAVAQAMLKPRKARPFYGRHPWVLDSAIARIVGQAADGDIVDLVTDTGKFMYENTGPNAHLMAADLIAAGIDHTAIYRRVYEGWPESKLRLFARALSRAERHAGGALTMTLLSAEDFAQTGAEESYTEGIVDRLRAVEGTKVAALARELLGGDGRWKVSLRSSDGDVDVSVIARAAGGGGHKAAAGLSTGMQPDELVAFLSDQVAAQL